MTDEPFIAWSTDRIAIHRETPQRTICVVKFRDRQRPTLCIDRPGILNSCAYFKDTESALEFCEILELNITEHK